MSSHDSATEQKLLRLCVTAEQDADSRIRLEAVKVRRASVFLGFLTDSNCSSFGLGDAFVSWAMSMPFSLIHLSMISPTNSLFPLF